MFMMPSPWSSEFSSPIDQCSLFTALRLLLHCLSLVPGSLSGLDLTHHTIFPSLYALQSHVRTILPCSQCLQIVPNAVPSLFEALSTYTRLTYLKLTNIAFPTLGTSDALSTAFSTISLSSQSPSSSSESSIEYIRIPVIPSLQTLYLGQTTFLSAPSIASYILNTIRSISDGRDTPSSPNTNAQLERVHLVDVYEGSIWGLRLRMPHIVTAALFLTEHPEYSDGYDGLEPGGGKSLRERLQDAIENLVLVEVKTERIMGGDRGS